MLTWLTQFFDAVSFWGVTQLFAAASTTDVVFVLLASKPIFIAAAFITGTIAYRRMNIDQLESESPDADHRLPE